MEHFLKWCTNATKVMVAYVHLSRGGMELSEKLKEIRLSERLTQSELCEVIGVKLSTWKSYELSRRSAVSSLELLKLTKHPRFMKYALWLVTDTTCPECGQISPL